MPFANCMNCGCQDDCVYFEGKLLCENCISDTEEFENLQEFDFDATRQDFEVYG